MITAEEAVRYLYEVAQGPYVERWHSTIVREFTPDPAPPRPEFKPDPQFPQYQK
jgi:hypothetical protein